MKLITKFKKVLSRDETLVKVYWCLNCGKWFYAPHLEKFVKHQIDFKHWKSEVWRLVKKK